MIYSVITIFLIYAVGIFFYDQIKEMFRKKEIIEHINVPIQVPAQLPEPMPVQLPINTIPSEKIIVIYKGSKYDITNFIRKHPGGKAVLLENNGADIEKLMLENEHSAYAYSLLEKYKIIE